MFKLRFPLRLGQVSRGGRRRLRQLGVLFWAGISTLAVSSLMVEHWQPLPVPPVDDALLQSAVSELRTREGTWMSVHVLYSGCRCSNQVLEHLLAVNRERPAGVDERVLLVGADTELEARVQRAGLALSVVETGALKTRFGVISAPLLVFLSPSDQVVYAGGYTDRKQSLDIQYLQIFAEVKRETSPRIRPLFGCGVSEDLQAAVDPFGLKYNRWSAP